MDKRILNTENQNFINSNLDVDITQLLFQNHPDLQEDIKELIEQIEAKKRCQNKLPTWFKTPQIYYPNKLNIEQTSSEVTASYKASLINGDSLIDLTGGFGVDAFYFAQVFKHVTHCEISETLSKIVAHNYQQLGKPTIKTVAQDGLLYLSAEQEQYDWVYVDPSRRHDSMGKVFFLKDCLPNVPEALDVLWQHTDRILIKTSPLLDLTSGKQELQYVKAIHVVAVHNEVKELLWELHQGYNDTIRVNCVNLKGVEQETFSFEMEAEAEAVVSFSQPLTYLYEPNAAILKAGGFKSVSDVLGLDKLHQHTHLYTSDALIDFPGRRFKLLHLLPYNKKGFKALGLKKANVSTRNFPETVAQLRKKLGIADGGTTYVFFTTTLDGKRMVLVCEKV